MWSRKAAHRDMPRQSQGADKRSATPESMESRLALIQEISLALNSTLDPEKLIDVILDSSIRYTGATTGSVMMLTEDGFLRIVAARGLGKNVGEEVHLRSGEGLTGWVAEHGEPVSVADVREDERYVMVKEHIRSELVVPMVLDRRVTGIISVDSTRVANFGDDDLQLLTILGTQAAQILENAKAFSELRRRARRDETLFEVSQALGASLDLEELFEKLLEILSRRCQMRRGFLVLTQPGSDELSIEVARGLTPEEIAKGRYQAGEGIIGRVVRSGEPFGVKDIQSEPAFLDRTGAFSSSEERLSFLCIPIFLENRVVGAFGAVKPFPGSSEFDEDMALLKIVASTLAQAVKIHRGVARERQRLLEENLLLREELGSRYQFDNLIGSSGSMQRVFSLVGNVAPTRSTVLIRGESGTGKELIAHAIHSHSPRAKQPFVRVNCAAIPEQLLEAELFGHVKGSFTGAVADRKGKFVLADGGTIFLDEIGDMSSVLQAKILRVLQEREVEVVGAEDILKVDVRVIAATHQNLEELIRAGEFREDLYYRLNVVPIVVPPLRERLEDVRALVEHFLDRYSRENDLPRVQIAPEALRILLRYSWPGNVRQLENAIERAVIFCDGECIQPQDLPDVAGEQWVETHGGGAGPETFGEAVEFYLDGKLGQAPRSGELWQQALGEVERILIDRAMERASGVQLQASEILGIHRNTLRKKLAERRTPAQTESRSTH